MPNSLGSIRGKVMTVEQYFRKNYRYSLEGFEASEGISSLEYFLNQRPPAHCEYFASAAVMLLRRQGIPARYVTGHLVREFQEDGEYWVARNRHAHAWAEAYDDEQNKWLIVEATPGVDAQNNGRDTNNVVVDEAAREQNTRAAQREESNTHLGLGQPIVATGIVGFVLCAGGAGFYWTKKRPAKGTDVVQREVRKLDRMVARRVGRRRSAETLHQYAKRLRLSAESPDDWLYLAADWYEQVATDFYAGSPASLPLRPVMQRAARGNWVH
jgi:hypothetical protein